MPSPDTTGDRRRVRAARSVIARVQAQRDWFATTYAAASTPQARFTAAATALRSAATSKKQRHPADVERRLDALTGQVVALLNELHTTQQAAAEATLRADKRRVARNERRNHDSAITSDPERAARTAAA